MKPVERVLGKLPDAKPSGKGWSAFCPAHEGRPARLSICEAKDGQALVKCNAGCDIYAICAALDLRVVDLFSTADTLPTPVKKKDNGSAPIVTNLNLTEEGGSDGTG